MSKSLPVRFFSSTTGNEPVRDFLLNLSAEDRRIVGVHIAQIEWGWPVGMPVCRLLRDHVYEVRANVSHGRIVRVLFTPFEGEAILLHAFVKKTQKTPFKDLELAIKRSKLLKAEV